MATGTREQADSMGANLRRQIADEVINSIAFMERVCGEPSIATAIEVLRQRLSSDHERISHYPDENDFRSIVTLAESYLSQWKWKEYTPSRLRALKEVFSRARTQPTIVFNDYDEARRKFRTLRMQTAPVIPLEKHETDENGEAED